MPLSELDRIGSRGADRGIMGSGVSDVGVCHFVSDRIQDLQEFGTVGGAVQQGGSKVSGHEKKKFRVCWESLRALPFPLYQIRAPDGQAIRRSGRTLSCAPLRSGWGTTAPAKPERRG